MKALLKGKSNQVFASINYGREEHVFDFFSENRTYKIKVSAKGRNRSTSSWGSRDG